MGSNRHFRIINQLVIIIVLNFVFLSTSFSQTASPSRSQASKKSEFIIKLRANKFSSKTTQLLNKAQRKSKLQRTFSNLNMHELKVNEGENVQEVIDELKNDPEIEYVEPNYILKRAQVYSMSDATAMSTGSYIQSNANTKVSQAWNILSQNQEAPIVAIIDTGVDYNHSIFQNTQSMWRNPNEIPNNGIDDDGNGYIDDVYGWNFFSGNNNPMDDEGHGTHLAGIVLGVGEDIFSPTPAISKIKLMSLKFMGADGTGTTADAISAIYYAVNNGAKVINNSWGGSNYSQALHDALTYAYNHGVFIASAAGNYSSNNDVSPLYPASLPIPSQIAVAATNDLDMLASFSSYGGSTVQLGAPGVGILSTYPNNKIKYMSGTSMATPFIAGLAALAIREAPQLSGYQIKSMIVSTVDTVSSLSGKVSSNGRVDSYQAIQLSKSSVTTESYQPGYSANPPSGVRSTASSTQTTQSGCGTISSGLLYKGINNSTHGPSGPLTVILILSLPLIVFVVTRTRWIKKSRRQFDRFVLNSEVRIKVDGRELVGNLSTIGLGGVSFSAETLLEKGGTVSMNIAGPDGQDQIQVLGRVVWSEDQKSYGVQFAQLNESVSDKIRFWSKKLIRT